VITTALLTLIIIALCGVTGMARACWIRSHDGSMTGKHELIADIEQDADGNPFDGGR
jgi:hypothetical protein